MNEWHDRYGGRYPNPETVCKGQCEGLGVYPDGNGHFIKCEDCGGTGKRGKA